MSFADVIGEIGKGRYLIALDFGEAARAETLANLDTYIATLQQTRADMQAKLTEAEHELDEQLDRVIQARDAYIALTKVNPDADPTAFGFERRKYLLMQAEARKYATRIQMLDGEIGMRSRQRDALAALVLTEKREAWCVTYTKGATGEVATIDLPGDDRLILIAPQARAWTSADGVLFARELCNQNQAFFNAAILAGWQSETPTYRRGTITGLDYDGNTADVMLAPATMTEQALNVNRRTSHSSIPVEYLNCNARAFEIGDEVVVQYKGRDWSDPVVIGFVHDPRPCYSLTCSAIPVYDGSTIYDGETIPAATAPAPPYPYSIPSAMLGWEIGWRDFDDERNTPPLDETVVSQILPELTWDVDSYPYTNRTAAAVYMQSYGLLTYEDNFEWYAEDLGVEIVSIGGDPETFIYTYKAVNHYQVQYVLRAYMLPDTIASIGYDDSVDMFVLPVTQWDGDVFNYLVATVNIYNPPPTQAEIDAAFAAITFDRGIVSGPTPNEVTPEPTTVLSGVTSGGLPYSITAVWEPKTTDNPNGTLWQPKSLTPSVPP